MIDYDTALRLSERPSLTHMAPLNDALTHLRQVLLVSGADPVDVQVVDNALTRLMSLEMGLKREEGS